MSFYSIAIALLFVFSAFSSLSAQNIRITGSIADDSTRKPLKSVRVMLRSLPDSALVKGVMSNGQGAFAFDVPPKNYLLSLQRIGYAMKHIPLQTSRENIDLKTITLKESSIITEDVEILGWREYTEIRPEKSVYTVQDNPNIIANTVSEVLDQIPAIQVDENGAVKLRGDDNVVIMINDRPLKMDAEQRNKMLQQLPSMNIKAIEVRTAPGAKFDAKFNGGIINIVMDKGLADFAGGNVYANGSTIRQRGIGGTLYYQDSSIASSLNFGTYRYYNENVTDYERINSLNPSEKFLNKIITTSSNWLSYYINPQVDITLTPKDVLSLSSSFHFGSGTYNTSGIGSRRSSDLVILQQLHDSSASDNSNSWMNFSVLYKHQFAENHSISLDLNHSNWSNSSDDFKESDLLSPSAELDMTNSLRQTVRKDESNPAYNLRLDYSYSPSKEWTIELGHKIEAENHPNDVNTMRYNFFTNSYATDTAQTLSITSHNALYALYANLGYQITESISAQVGARYEHASIGADFSGIQIDRSYPNLFPSASFSWVISPEYRLTASYNRSISLPWVGLLNPRVNRETATSQFVGNPDIRPEFTHTAELNLSAFLGSHTLSIAPYFKRTADEVQYNTQLIGDIMTSSYTNFNGSRSIGLNGSYNYRSRNGFSARMNFDIQNFSNLGGTNSSDFTTNSTYGSGNGAISYEVIKDLTLSANTRYTSPFTNGGMRSLSFISTNFSAIYKMFDNALTLNFTAADPFDMQRRERVNAGTGFTLSSDSKPLSRFFSLNISYAFGKSNVNLEQHNQEKTSVKGNTGG
ncbi:MAG: TonB-dependent receptor [Ignavibacteria bacterium]|nr:TonB-dependent receptor [Ignavibacteria bacterium]